MAGETEATQALISLEFAKRWLKKADNSDDALIIQLVNEVSASAERYCRRHFLSASYVHDGTTLPRLVPFCPTKIWLPNPPVTAVTTLKAYNSGSTLTESTDGYTGDYVIHQGPGIVELISGNVFPYLSLPSVVITYTGGWLAAGAGTAASLKEWGWEQAADDFKRSVAEQVAWVYRLRTSDRYGVQSVSAGGTTVQYMTDAILPSVRRVWDSYSRILPSWL